MVEQVRTLVSKMKHDMVRQWWISAQTFKDVLSCDLYPRFMPAVTNLREGSPCLSLTAHRFPQRLESDHHVYWRQWHLWLLHRHCEHPPFFHLALIFTVTIKLFDMQTDNLSNNETCKSQYFSSWCCFFCTFSGKKKPCSFFTDLFLAQEHSHSYPGSPGHPPQRGVFSLLCCVVKTSPSQS